MTFPTRSAGFVLILAGCLISGCTPTDRALPVTDKANLFKTSTRQRASARIADIEQRYHKHLVIETARQAEPRRILIWLAQPRSLQSMDPAERERYLHDEWAAKVLRDRGPNTIYVLIFKEAPTYYVHIEVGSDPQLQEAFPPEDQARLREQILTRLKENRTDDALAETVQFIGDTLNAHLGAEIPPPRPFDWAPVLWTLLAFLGVWVVIELAEVLTGGHFGGGRIGFSSSRFGGGGSFLAGLFTTVTGEGNLTTILYPPLPRRDPEEPCPIPTMPDTQEAADRPVEEPPDTPDLTPSESPAPLHGAEDPDFQAAEHARQTHGEP